MTREHYDSQVPMCVNCDLDECDPCHCVRVTSLIRTGKKTLFTGDIVDRQPVTKAESKPKFSTTIKKKYWQHKVIDHVDNGYFIEYKNQNQYWNPRIERLMNNLPCEGVFLVGKNPHRVSILEITEFIPKDIPERYRDEISTPMAWALKCQLV